MRRASIMLAILLLVPAGLAATPARADDATRQEKMVAAGTVCDYAWWRGPKAVKRLIWCAAKHFNSPGGPEKALSVAKCESNFDPSAYNKTGCGGHGCGGVYQQHMLYWPERAEKYGFKGKSVFNGRANIIVSVRMAKDAGSWERDWPGCA